MRTKHVFRKMLAAFLAVLCCVTTISVGASAKTTQPQLRFRDDGTFKLLFITDIQDYFFPRPAVITYINRVLDQEKPDLVVFGGDNTNEAAFYTGLEKISIDWFIQPLVKRNIPFDVVMGNHDSPLQKVARHAVYNLYTKYPNSYARESNPLVFGTGNHNTPIYSADGKTMLFNLWMIDSNDYDIAKGITAEGHVRYDYVHPIQVEWFLKSDKEIEKNQGHKIPSLLFQHIIVPEAYECLLPATAQDTNTRIYNGIKYAKKLDPKKASGILGEFPCPPVANSGELAAAAERGVLGILSGHDHVNAFIGKVNGVDLIQSPGVSWCFYGNENVRGCREIILNKNDLSKYETKLIRYTDLFATEADKKLLAAGTGSASTWISFVALLGSAFGLDKYATLDKLLQKKAERG